MSSVARRIFRPQREERKNTCCTASSYTFGRCFLTIRSVVKLWVDRCCSCRLDGPPVGSICDVTSASWCSNSDRSALCQVQRWCIVCRVEAFIWCHDDAEWLPASAADAQSQSWRLPHRRLRAARQARMRGLYQIRSDFAVVPIAHRSMAAAWRQWWMTYSSLSSV